MTFTKSVLGSSFVLLGIFSMGCPEEVLIAIPPPEVHVDELAQEQAAKVDILWVVDNSESMREEQDALAANFSRFITSLTLCQGTGVENDLCDFATKTCAVSGNPCNPPDYQIGVINTDTRADKNPGELQRAGLCVASAGMLPQGEPVYCRQASDCAAPNPFCDPNQSLTFVGPNTANAASAFSTLVRVGTAGGAREEGLRAAAIALGRDTNRMTGQWMPAPATNDGFLRDDASLFVIFVTDEEDASFGEVPYFYRAFETLKGAGNEGVVSISAIVGDPDINGPGTGGCSPDGVAQNAAGMRYIGLAMYSRGLSAEFRACDELRLTCAADSTCQRPVAELPGICAPSTPCMIDQDCGSIQCGNDTGCIQCLNGACTVQQEVFSQFLSEAGVYQSICDNDYGEVLDALGFEAAGLSRKFNLTKNIDCQKTVPCCNADVAEDACTTETEVCVRVEGQVVTRNRAQGWVYESGSNAIFFDGAYVPGPGQTVTVSYRSSNVDGNLGCGVLDTEQTQ